MVNQLAVPTLRRRRLGNELARKRREAGMESQDLAAQMGWPKYKLSKVENAASRVKPAEVQQLLAILGIPADAPEVNALMNLAKDAAQRGWWAPFGDVATESYRDLLDVEADAEMEKVVSPLLIPGLLQTTGYAREIIAATGLKKSPGEVIRLAELRRGRQDILTARSEREPLKLWAVIGEGALHLRRVSRPAVMRDQLQHLQDMAELPNVTVQVLALEGPAHPGMIGVTEIVEFPAMWPTVVHLEHMLGGQFLEGDDDVRAFQEGFDRVRAVALSESDSLRKIQQIKDGMS
ncbi:helix-turn-helix domain-containing protein [Streptomyces sp. NPDC001054]